MIQLNNEDFFPAGTIIKPHGLRGEFILEIGEGLDEYLVDQECLMVGIDGGLVPFFITEEGINFRTSTTVSLSFEDIDNVEKVRPLCGCKVFLPNSASRDEAAEDSFDALIGYVVFDEEKGRLGRITRSDNFSGNVVLTVEYHSREILIPFSENLITGINNDKKEIRLACPEGLIDLYLE